MWNGKYNKTEYITSSGIISLSLTSCERDTLDIRW